MANKIPQELMDAAKGLGCNVINYITTTSGDGDIYSLAAADESGEYLPIGLPILYAVRGSLIRRLDEERTFDILSNIED